MNSFYTKITDERLHRITIDSDTWKRLDLKRGDWIKVTIEKTEKP